MTCFCAQIVNVVLVNFFVESFTSISIHEEFDFAILCRIDPPEVLRIDQT